MSGVHEIDAPPGVHIVDHVTYDWFARPRPLQVGLSRRLERSAEWSVLSGTATVPASQVSGSQRRGAGDGP